MRSEFTTAQPVSFADSKVCERCKTAKTLDRFLFSARSYRHGRVCLDCQRTKRRASLAARDGARSPEERERQRLRGLEKNREWRETHPEESKASNRDSAAKQRRRLTKREKTWNRVRCFGLTFAEYKAMYERQRGCCAICGEPEGERVLNIDHDHTTLAVRGLLCGRCNHGLGSFRDDEARMFEAIRYLRRSRQAQKNSI